MVYGYIIGWFDISLEIMGSIFYRQLAVITSVFIEEVFELKELYLQYPLISGNPLCDGTWHQISAHRLWRLANSPQMFILEYYDRKRSVSCQAVLVYTIYGLQKAPLISYVGLNRMTRGLLIQVDTGYLPDYIYAFGVSYDLMDLSLRMMCGDGQAMYVCREKYQIATLFICDSEIYTGRLTKDGLAISRPSNEELLNILKYYFIVWRDDCFNLIWDDVVVLRALDWLMDDCARRCLDAEILEFEMVKCRPWNIGDIPEWVVRGTRCYGVQIIHAK